MYKAREDMILSFQRFICPAKGKREYGSFKEDENSFFVFLFFCEFLCNDCCYFNKRFFQLETALDILDLLDSGILGLLFQVLIGPRCP